MGVPVGAMMCLVRVNMMLMLRKHKQSSEKIKIAING